MKNIALADSNSKLSWHFTSTEAANDDSLHFFVVPTTYKGFLWLINNKIIGYKLTNPTYNKIYKTLTGTMEK